MASINGDDDGSGYGARGTSPTGSGVIGDGPQHAGVVATSVTGSGVSAFSDSGPGVVSLSNSGPGVAGRSVDGDGVTGMSDRGLGVSGESGDAVGVQGRSALDNGVLGSTDSGESAGVFGRNAAAEDGNGVVGLADGLRGIGVFGRSERRGIGVVGSGATGVSGQGGVGPGVQGSSSSSHGVAGSTDRAGAAGVLGIQRSAPGAGVRGEGLDVGVEGVGKSGVRGRGISGASNSIGVAGVADGLGAHGVSGEATGDWGKGLEGVANGFGARGVTGEATGNDTIGVAGKGETGVSGTGEIKGVSGSASPGAVAGVWGEGRGQTPGVRGDSQDGPGVMGMSPANGTGVYGFATNGAGVVGRSIYPTNIGPHGFAGNFMGAVNVTGPVHKSGGGFRIDHPLEPEEKYLDHSFVESDEMKNIYDGTAQLDVDGIATISLPPWLEVLNADFRYQLTALGRPAPQLHIGSELADGSFTIAGGNPDQRVCWQISGRRQDRWAETYPVTPEVDKLDVERGRYRHPELYDLPPERGVAFGQHGDLFNDDDTVRETLKRLEQQRDTPDESD